MNRCQLVARLFLRLSLLALLGALVGFLLPTAPASSADAPVRPTASRPHRTLGPGSTHQPGFTGYVTAGGAALGVGRLPDGRIGICLDTGRRVWPTRGGHDVYRRDPQAGFLTSRYLPTARRDPITAAALWWAVGLDLHLNSGARRMRRHLQDLRHESPGTYRRIHRHEVRMLAGARRYAAPRSGYSEAATLGHDVVSGIGVHAGVGRLVPGVAVTLELRGGVFADGRRVWHGRSRVKPVSVRWTRVGGGPVHLAMRYAGLPASGYRMVRTGRHYQRVAVDAGMGAVTRRRRLAALPRPALHTTVSDRTVMTGSTLVDTVTVSGSGSASLRGRWRLLGPVLPGTTGCAALDWGSAPVAGSGTFSLTGSAGAQVGRTRVSQPGCYTYVERLDASATTRATRWSTPGNVAETSTARAKPVIHTAVSQRRIVAGKTLRDAVVVTGLPSGLQATLRWRLRGPVAPYGSTCQGVRWSDAPTRARGQVTAIGRPTTTRVTVGRTVVRRGGCYSYEERLDATGLTVATGWTHLGIAGETTAVRPPHPEVPHHPVVDTGGSRRAAQRAGSPAGVRIPSVRLSAALLPVGFHGRRLAPPHDLADGGWWSGGTSLDSLVGTSVVVGHVADDHGRLGPFARLRRVRAGAIITTVAPDGATTRWRVTGSRSVDRTRLPRSLFAQGMRRQLVLITCTDKVTHPNGAFHYRRNLVVTAIPVRP
ncbi:MAG: class F sortase [Nocardioidaceae bacterium]|nr:class F sortase [Nocardioidaceae bacterium]MCL2612114.1 class F sortase [Nocardioidaceae bacterium]